MKRNKITNTTDRDPRDDFTVAKVLAMSGCRPGAEIEDQERRGHEELAGSITQLPTKGTQGDDRGLWEALGFQFEGPTKGDEIWTDVVSPAGWTTKRTDHVLYSTVVDERGRERATIGYKAAHYDRWCNVYLLRRYRVTWVPEKPGGGSGPAFGIVTDGGKEIHRTAVFVDDPGEWTVGSSWLSGYDKAQLKARSWLDAEHPNHGDIMAYWNED